MKNPPLPASRVLFTQVSQNAKTGPIPTAMSLSSTCPMACPFRKDNAGGCYAANGPIALHWRRLDKPAPGASFKGILGWPAFMQTIRHSIWPGQLWRYGTAGDLPGEGDKTDGKALAEMVAANKGRKGFAYTHRPVLSRQGPAKVIRGNRAAIKAANQNGFTVNLSANTLAHADELLKLGIAPVVSVVPSTQVTNCRTPGGARVLICPASIRENVNCARCGLCQRKDRDYVIAFPAHGVSTAKANAIAAA